MMSRVHKGIVAGLAATMAVSVLEAANLYGAPMLGMAPWAASFPRLLSVMLQTPDVMAVGWIAHFLIGTFVLGSLFGVLCPRLPTDTPESKGILFAVGAYIVMGLTIAPAVGLLGGRPEGMFFMQAGFGTLAWMIATHAIYGIVLGSTYGWMLGRDKRVLARADGQPAH